MFERATYYRDKKPVHYFDENGEETLYIGGSFAGAPMIPGVLFFKGEKMRWTSDGF